MKTNPLFPRNLAPKLTRVGVRKAYGEIPDEFPTNKYINKKAQAPILIGQVTSGTINSFTDDTADWLENEFIDKVVKLYKEGGIDFIFGLVKSNTSDTIVFDDNLIMEPCSDCGYEILDTIVLSKADMHKVIALNIFEYNVAVVLPKVEYDIERKYLHIYVERSDNGSHTAVIIGRGKDYQLGAKYGNLNYNGEGVTLYSHTWDSNTDEEGPDARPHWDIINIQGIQRIGSGYWSSDETISSGTFKEIGENLTIDVTRKFLPAVVEDVIGMVYTSLITKKFYAEFNAIIEKTGGAAEAHITIGILKVGTTDIIPLDDRQASSRFGAGVGFQTLHVKVPVQLNRGDRIVAMARNTGGTFNVGQGSTLDIYEV